MIATAPNMVFKFAPGVRFPVKPQVVGEELKRIEDASDGHLTPSAVVASAKPKSSPLHPCFEWDDRIAANIHREDVARRMIRGVVYEEVVESPGENTSPVKAYVHVVEKDAGPCYVPITRAMGDEELREQVLADALTLLRGVQRRYAHLSELKGVFAEIDRVAERIEAQRKRP